MGEADREAAIREYLERDPFVRGLGVKLEAIEPGYCRTSLTISEEMTNFHRTSHGAVIFALADAALAGASNSRGQTAFALTINIAFLSTSGPGDHLVAEAREQQSYGPTPLYELVVKRDGSEEPIARAQAMPYRKKEWFVAP